MFFYCLYLLFIFIYDQVQHALIAFPQLQLLNPNENVHWVVFGDLIESTMVDESKNTKVSDGGRLFIATSAPGRL